MFHLWNFLCSKALLTPPFLPRVKSKCLPGFCDPLGMASAQPSSLGSLHFPNPALAQPPWPHSSSCYLAVAEPPGHLGVLLAPSCHTCGLCRAPGARHWRGAPCQPHIESSRETDMSWCPPCPPTPAALLCPTTSPGRNHPSHIQLFPHPLTGSRLLMCCLQLSL